MATGEKKSLFERASGEIRKKSDKPKKNVFKSIAKWFREMRSELKKVVWPTPKQVANNTGVALVVMLVFAVVLWGFDSLAQSGVKALITLAG